ncbi:hypothetical protein C7G91_04810 [Acinetobacter nosocomialis]|uniref:hypothetical protein n=1 Tax=Acinetobacter nosocomialis TaxID=106654 RepID=UPI000D0B4691|nr:hypothetical protein [Acinetobacter nosocomialis]PSE43969.1 hypothetical protein C7G97_12050 [Acinetobacter nosocomialis]PSE85352.1 hypothetical protein C7G91_04810 [Acinetobacter nosocomialis]
MGLSCTAYKKLSQFEGTYDDQSDSVLNEKTGLLVKDSDYFLPSLNSHFPNHAKELIDGGFYTFEEDYWFRAGSYSGYNNFREQLAKLAGYPALEGEGNRHYHSNGAWKATSGPFWELINFSDCEGVIGTAYSKKLLADFKQFDEKAKELGEYFYESYSDWMTAFEFASDDGAVDFH